MFSFHLTKFFLLSALIFLLFAGCGPWRPAGDADSSPTPAVAEDLKSEIPFSTGEPERFQAEIVVTAGDEVRRTFIARDGARRRYDFNFGAKNQLTALQADKNYRILPARRVFTENAAATDAGDGANFLATEWLGAQAGASFEKLETAENLTKYRVRLGESAASEIFVFVDETLQMPVRQEFYAAGGAGDEPKTPAYSFELKNLKLATDANLFTVPADFKKVSAEEFEKLLRAEE